MSQSCSGAPVLHCSCSIRVSSPRAAAIPWSAELPPAWWGGRAGQRWAQHWGLCKSSRTQGARSGIRGQARVCSLRGKGPRKDFIWWEPKDSFASRAYKARVRNVALIAIGKRETTGAFLYGPTPPMHLSPLAVQGRREAGSLTNCSAQIWGSIARARKSHLCTE